MAFPTHTDTCTHSSCNGVALVTDLQFWKEDPAWEANVAFLKQHHALLIEGVDVFNVAGTLGNSSQFPLNLSDIGLVVVGGFHPHYLMPAVVQAIAHQLPSSDVMMLYASRDSPPDFQDKNLIHMQAWTADAANGYVIRAGGQGVGGDSRCWSAESAYRCGAKKRKVSSDPSLVKVSVFTRCLSNVRLVGAQISPAATVQSTLNTGRHVVFCGEGDASLARSCLQPPPMSDVHDFPTPNRFFPEHDRIETYATWLQRAAAEGISLPDAAWQWAMAWPTTMPLQSECSPSHGHAGTCGRSDSSSRASGS